MGEGHGSLIFWGLKFRPGDPKRKRVKLFSTILASCLALRPSPNQRDGFAGGAASSFTSVIHHLHTTLHHEDTFNK